MWWKSSKQKFSKNFFLPFQIAWRAALLGFVFSTGFYILLHASTQWKAFGIYSMFLAIFHYSEYLGIAISNPSTLSVDSFILNHSLHYHIAAVSSWIEFGIESHFFPGELLNWILDDNLLQQPIVKIFRTQTISMVLDHWCPALFWWWGLTKMCYDNGLT